jgi:hypothetical protein
MPLEVPNLAAGRDGLLACAVHGGCRSREDPHKLVRCLKIACMPAKWPGGGRCAGP